ncbi:hypothetical protein Daus18300_013609 [Diaporthe australafricana]|uniref:Uncharacterized protein n=1 Tax=Diaporthe australafricana TaxID=127596 RepID=A0ABR3VYH0_9PEZI
MTVDLEATTHDAKTSTTGSLAELPQFWNHDKVPGSDSEDFKQWILRNPECEKEGGEDQAGHSGMFSMDHQTTREPWEVHGRALDLDALSQNLGEEFTYDLHLSLEFCPKQLPQVKWVNWRWPRYEFDTKLPNVSASFQWIVHDGAVLQQFVIENLGDEPVNFKHRFYRDMWIRDLDYLEPAYHFNDGEEGYTRVPGPNGYGHVCVHALEKDDIADHTDSIPKAAAEAQLPEPGGVQIVYTNKVVEIPLSNDEAHAQAKNETSGGNVKPAEKTDQLPTKPGSVAALITLFVNGKAIKFLDDQELWYEHQVEGNRIDSNGTVPGTLEIVVAYKMILLPGNEVDWRNFLVPAREADVSKILREETQRLWGTRDPKISSLCSLGLSFANQSPEQPDVEVEDMRNVMNEGKETPRDQHNAEKDRTEADVAVNEGDGDAVSSKKVDDGTDVPDGGGNSGSKPTGPSMPSGLVERESSPKSHIEYLAWRHLEHILSVCTVPVLPTALIEDGSTRVETHSSASQRASGKEEPKSEDVFIALTCGDMSGHRIGTSAS